MVHHLGIERGIAAAVSAVSQHRDATSSEPMATAPANVTDNNPFSAIENRFSTKPLSYPEANQQLHTSRMRNKSDRIPTVHELFRNRSPTRSELILAAERKNQRQSLRSGGTVGNSDRSRSSHTAVRV